MKILPRLPFLVPLLLAAASAVRVDVQLRSANGDRVDASAYAVMKNSAEYARQVNR